MVQLYFCDIKDALEEATAISKVPDRIMSVLDEYRKERVNAIKPMAEKVRSAAAGMLLHTALLRETADIDGKFKAELDKEEHGKPFIKNLPGFYFSISHSGDYVVLATSDSPVGVDVQTVNEKTGTDGIARRFFSESENRYLESISDPEGKKQCFYRIWASKEAFVKMTGDGLYRPLESFNVDLDKLLIFNKDNSTVLGYLTESDIMDECKLMVCMGKQIDKLITEKVII